MWTAQRLRERKARAEAISISLAPADPGSARHFDDACGEVVELQPQLSSLVAGALRLRLLLEAADERLASAAGGVTPWARRDAVENWDLTVVDLRRAVWTWRAGFARLDAVTCHQLRDLGLAGVPLNRLLLHDLDRSEGPWEPVLWAPSPDASTARGCLRRAWLELRRFEELALACGRSSYRMPA